MCLQVWGIIFANEASISFALAGPRFRGNVVLKLLLTKAATDPMDPGSWDGESLPGGQITIPRAIVIQSTRMAAID